MGSESERTAPPAMTVRERTLEPSKGSNQPNGLTGWPKRDWPGAGSMYGGSAFTPDGPVDSAALRRAQNGRSERSNHPALSAWSMAEQVPAACAGAGGMVQEANAPGNAGDTQTWTTTEGM